MIWHAHPKKYKHVNTKCKWTTSQPVQKTSTQHHAHPNIQPLVYGEKKSVSGVWRGMVVRLYSPLTFLYKGRKKSVKSLLFLTQKGAEECLKFREGCRVWNLSPRGQTGGFFSFQALIDSPLSSLATQKDTWKNFWWGCDVRNRVTCSADALSWFLTSTSAPQRLYSWTFQLFLLLHTGEDFKTLFPAFHVYQHASKPPLQRGQMIDCKACQP